MRRLCAASNGGRRRARPAGGGARARRAGASRRGGLRAASAERRPLARLPIDAAGGGPPYRGAPPHPSPDRTEPTIRPRARRTALLLITLAAGAAALPGHAAAGQSTFAFSDGVVTPAVEPLAIELRQRRAAVCRAAGRPSRPPSPAASLRAAQRLVRRSAGARALRRLSASPQTRTAARATATAAAALAAGKDHAALAALLRAHARARRDPRPLVNAATVLANLGRPREALGLLTAAQRLRAPRRTPLALAPQALIANGRGHALLGLGRWAEAERALAQAARKAPLLSEARRNLAHAQLCQGRFAAAAASLRTGARRQPPTPTTVVATVDEAGRPRDEQLAPQRWLDLGHGVEPSLQGFLWPADAAAADGALDRIRSLGAAAVARYQAVVAEKNRHAQAAGGEARSLSPATRARIDSLWRIAASVDRHPDLRPLYEAHLARKRAAGLLLTRYGAGQAGGTCGAGPFQEWRAALLAHEEASYAWTRAAYRRITAVAANAASADLHRAIAGNAQILAAGTVSDLLQQWEALASLARSCRNEEGRLPVAADPGPDETALPLSLACPTGIAGMSFKAKLLDGISISLSCEKVSGEFDAGGVLGLFAQVSYTGRSGETSIFAGPRVKVKTPGPLGPGASYKDGVYVTFGRDGSIRDFGARVEAGAGFAAGDGQVAIKLDAMDFSLVGVSPLETLLGPPR